MSSDKKYLLNLENFRGSFVQETLFHLEIVARTMKINFFEELYKAFEIIKTLPEIRCILLTSSQKHFSTGLDLMDAAASLVPQDDNLEPGRNGVRFYNLIKNWQDALAFFQNYDRPVIVGIDNMCIGGGVDLISACDIRVCTQNAKFTIKEVDIGLCADIGTTQRLPLICSNDSKLRELMYTGRFFDAQEAQQIGLVSSVYKDKAEMIQKMVEMGQQIASKSPIPVWTIKNVMNHQQKQGLEANMRYQQAINSAMLQTKDIQLAVMAGMNKQKPVFPKL